MIVAYGNQIAMEPTLEQSLARIFGGRSRAAAAAAAPPRHPDARPAGHDPRPPNASLAQRAWEAWTRSQDALRRATGPTYGAEQKHLEDALRALTESRR